MISRNMRCAEKKYIMHWGNDRTYKILVGNATGGDHLGETGWVG